MFFGVDIIYASGWGSGGPRFQSHPRLTFQSCSRYQLNQLGSKAASESTFKKSNTCGVSNNRLYFMQRHIRHITKIKCNIVNIYNLILIKIIIGYPPQFNSSDRSPQSSSASHRQIFKMHFLFAHWNSFGSHETALTKIYVNYIN